MSIFSLSSSSFPPSFPPASASQEPKIAENRVLIADAVMLNRLDHLALQRRRRPFEYHASFELPLVGQGKKTVTLSFPFNVNKFLTRCKEKLNFAGFRTAEQIQFKGGALHFVLD